MGRKNSHIVISMGTRKDLPPAGHIWCEFCGRSESLFKEDVRVFELKRKLFAKFHSGCVSLRGQGGLLDVGYIRVGDNYVWGGHFSISQVAEAAHASANLLLDEEGDSSFCYHQEDAETAVEWITHNRNAKPKEFYENNLAVFRWVWTEWGKLPVLWLKERVTVFHEVSKTLLYLGEK